MQIFEYSLTHPYPRGDRFNLVTLALIVIVTPVLVIVNIVTVGYELVPTLYSAFDANQADPPHWWNSPRLPPLLRRTPPPCEPKDIGRGDAFYLTSSLFEYKVISSWKKPTNPVSPEDEGRVAYRGESFDQCSIYSMRFDYSLLDFTQTVTVGIYCPKFPVRAYLETTLVFAEEISKDLVGQYYGYDTDLFNILDPTSRDYRKAVFGVLDVISTDSIAIMAGQYIPGGNVLALSARANVTGEDFFETTTVTYLNGTFAPYYNGSLGVADIYRASITNLMNAVYDAVMLDLGNLSPDNIFLNQSAVNGTFDPNLAPIPINPDAWVRDSTSFYYGSVVAPYQTWAQMLLAGLPRSITLGNLTGIPANSTMITNYLCPSYQLRQRSSFLANIFIGTSAMLLSAWGTWTFVTAFIAKKIRGPCVVCTCGTLLDGKGDHTHRDSDRGVALSGLATGLVAPPLALRNDTNTSSMAATEKDE